MLDLLHLFDIIGKNGPSIVFLISIYLLYKKPILLITYIIGYIFNILFNFGFKGIFRMPRPNENVEKFDAEIRLNKYINFKRFGMPSSHAQAIIYSLVFISAALSIKNKEKGLNINKNWISLIILLSIITLAQRIHFKLHTFFHIFIGSIIGALIGYIFFYYSQVRSRGSLAHKPEQNAPI